MKRFTLVLICLVAISQSTAWAVVVRKDNGVVIPGTENIDPSPGADFSDLDLSFAALNARNLTGALFTSSNLTSATFLISNLSDADLAHANLSNAVLDRATLTNANFANALVTGAILNEVTLKGFTKEQLYSTASYLSKDLQGVQLDNNNLESWDFSGQDLTNGRLSYLKDANLQSANLTNVMFSNDVTDANFTDAVIEGASIGGTFTETQLFSTASYKAKNLAGVALPGTIYKELDLHGFDLNGAAFYRAELSDTNLSGTNLTGARLEEATLSNANLAGSMIAGANFSNTTSSGFTAAMLYSTTSHLTHNLQGIQLLNNDLTGWDFSDQNLTGAAISGTLTDADFSGAIVKRAALKGLSKEQLYSTASYESGDLESVKIAGDLTAWNFQGQNLASASFGNATLVNADFTGANLSSASFLSPAPNAAGAKFIDANLAGANLDKLDLTGAQLNGADLRGARLHQAKLAGADFSGAIIQGAVLSDVTPLGFTKEQFYSTASYLARNLRGIVLTTVDFRANYLNDLSGWDFHNQDLTDADLFAANVTGANFSGAILVGTRIQAAHQNGFTKEMLYSTASYIEHDLQRINLRSSNLTGWDFHDQNLTGAALGFSSNFTDANFANANLTSASFFESTLTNADFGGAIIGGADFGRTTDRGFTQEQLYATASYESRQLTGIALNENNLSGWDFHDQNLANANFRIANLTDAMLNGANLTGANLNLATLTNADLTGALVNSANLSETTSRGLTKEQLYLTASYQQQNLTGVNLRFNDLSAWDLSGQNLTNANFQFGTWVDTNFRLADLRGAVNWNPTGAITDNTIFPNGSIDGLDLSGGEQLVVRNYYGDPANPIGVTIQEAAQFIGGTLELQFDSGVWNSLVKFEEDATVDLGGALNLDFAGGTNLLSQVGRTFQVFDWTGVEPTGAFAVASAYPWDLSELYTTGEVTLLLPGDTNGDQAVTIADLNNVRNNFGADGGLGDTNGDQLVDIQDLSNVRNFFGASTPQAAPEPSTFVLAALLVAGGLVVRRRA